MGTLKPVWKGIDSLTTLLFGSCLLLNCHISLAQNLTYCNVTTYGLYANEGTLCRFQGLIGRGCGRIIRSNDTFTPEIKDYIVELHNNLRTLVAAGNETRGTLGPQPSAMAMKKLKWNSQIAQAAQTWANQCLFQSDANRNETNNTVTSPTTPVYIGQNIYGRIDSPNNYLYTGNLSLRDYWYQAILRWYNEVRMFDNRVVGNYTYQRLVSHYTQIVSDLTTDIGCGFNQWQISSGFARMLVCNYGPGGNIPGQRVYATGNACSGCLNSTLSNVSTCANSLCGNLSHFKVL